MSATPGQTPKLCHCPHPKPKTDEHGDTRCMDCGLELAPTPAAPREALRELIGEVLDKRQEPLVKAKTAALIARVHVRTIYRHEHELGAIPYGREWRFDPERVRQGYRRTR
jgi:hypothetical protein